ncbi:uncharacterized protein B0J16DRAFT_320994 [Fusarium flagelliforme]|uniref:uncharacterized protein n=1 Tax=Fusarium flagelliforme TaxID=2675880 RepID=UPI001E8CCD7E|nr:uncharacterized protein B0J16DRAFT_320994 [Fusarium flagelliforme]KAH7186250.1 hypothetical protein B0J16DRAFT_320994 [Fusarium flagelliforme]
MDHFLVVNPQVWKNCTNLWLDYSYCVKPVGAITTYPGYGGTAAPSATSRPFKKTESTDQSDHNSTTDTLDRFHSTVDIIPIANGTRLDCQHYWWLDNSNETTLSNCYLLSRIYSIEFEDFILWNPSLADTDTGDTTLGDAASITETVTDRNDFTNSCTISTSVSYCVSLSSATTAASADTGSETPTPRAVGEIANCTMWFLLEREARCEDLMATYDLEFDEFYETNPSAKKDCSGLVLGTNYCQSTYPDGAEVDIPGRHSDEEDGDEVELETLLISFTSEAGATGTKQATPSPDTKIDLETFYKWNPSVQADCSRLELGTYVCVGSS